MSELDDELSVDINIRSAREIGERMVILAALIRIALVESEDDDEADPADATAELNDLRDGLQFGTWEASVSPEERLFMQRAGGHLTEVDVLAMMWRVDALAALNWATSLGPQPPPPWIPIDPALAIDPIPAPWDEVDAFISGLNLRDEEAIAAERECAELWAWRGAIDEDLVRLRGRERAELEATLNDVAEEAADAELLEASTGDFAVDGKPYAQASPEAKAFIAEVSLQRLQALNWLCGFGETWDDVPLDV